MSSLQIVFLDIFYRVSITCILVFYGLRSIPVESQTLKKSLLFSYYDCAEEYTNEISVKAKWRSGEYVMSSHEYMRGQNIYVLEDGRGSLAGLQIGEKYMIPVEDLKDGVEFSVLGTPMHTIGLSCTSESKCVLKFGFLTSSSLNDFRDTYYEKTTLAAIRRRNVDQFSTGVSSSQVSSDPFLRAKQRYKNRWQEYNISLERKGDNWNAYKGNAQVTELYTMFSTRTVLPGLLTIVDGLVEMISVTSRNDCAESQSLPRRPSPKLFEQKIVKRQNWKQEFDCYTPE